MSDKKQENGTEDIPLFKAMGITEEELEEKRPYIQNLMREATAYNELINDLWENEDLSEAEKRYYTFWIGRTTANPLGQIMGAFGQ